MTDLLRVQGLSAGYGDVRALWEVDLTVSGGEVVVVLGRNGAGKTTLLSAIAGIVPAASGSIHLSGRALRGDPPYDRVKAGLALVQEGKRIFRRLTVEENLMVAAYSLRRQTRRRLIERAYERFPILGERRTQPAGALSGGQQQMLAIAQALLPEPRLVMLDEPSAGLAPAISAEVFRIAATLAREDGLGVLVVEQAVESAVAVADRVTVLELGRVVTSVPAREIEDLTVIRQIYLGGSGHPPTAR